MSGSKIQKYNQDISPGVLGWSEPFAIMKESDDGGWVKTEDHEKEVEGLKAKLALHAHMSTHLLEHVDLKSIDPEFGKELLNFMSADEENGTEIALKWQEVREGNFGKIVGRLEATMNGFRDRIVENESTGKFKEALALSRVLSILSAIYEGKT